MSSTAVTDHFFYQQDRLVSRHSDKHIRLLYAEKLLAQLDARTGEHSMLLQTDLNGSVLNARVQQRIRAYTPYGFSPDDSGRVLAGFNGEYLDVVTLGYPLGQAKRFYLSKARFNSPDPLGPFGEGGTNCYTYCKGDPVNFADPTGLARVFQRPQTTTPSSPPVPFHRRAPASGNSDTAAGRTLPLSPSSSRSSSNRRSAPSTTVPRQASGTPPQQIQLRELNSISGNTPASTDRSYRDRPTYRDQNHNLSLFSRVGQAWTQPGPRMQNFQIAIYLPYNVVRMYPVISILVGIGIVGAVVATVVLTRKN